MKTKIEAEEMLSKVKKEFDENIYHGVIELSGTGKYYIKIG